MNCYESSSCCRLSRGLCYGIAAAAVAGGCFGEAEAKQAEGDLPEPPTGTAASNTGEVLPPIIFPLPRLFVRHCRNLLREQTLWHCFLSGAHGI